MQYNDQPLLDDDGFRALLNHFDRPWKGYRRVRKGVKKRIRRHMRECGCPTVDDYLALLEGDEEVRSTCQDLLRVTISRFFRDRVLWQRISRRVLPELLKEGSDVLRIWSAGCACGEEPYSLAIVRDRLGKPAELEILATDDDPLCLERAQAGEYTRSSLRELRPETIHRYFRVQGKHGYRIEPHLREDISWKRHNLLQQPPPGCYHMIFLRNNLFTYYNQAIAARASRSIIERLVPGGYLAIGCHEQLPEPTDLFVADDEVPFLFRKR